MKTLKYKHIVKGIVLGCMLMTGTGCDDFLDITPPSNVAPENYLVEESQLAAYTIRYYTDNFPSLNSLYGDDEMATDKRHHPQLQQPLPNWRMENSGKWRRMELQQHLYLELFHPICREESGNRKYQRKLNQHQALHW